MKRVRKSMVGMAVIGLLLASMFVSAAEAWLCRDCGPAGTLAALSGGNPFHGSDSFGRTDGGQSAPEQGHAAGACPTCLSPPILADNRIDTFLKVSHDTIPQGLQRLYSALDTHVYRPPRATS